MAVIWDYNKIYKKTIIYSPGKHMSQEFVYTLQRSGGGESATLRVTDSAIIFTIPSDVSNSELEAIKGIEALAMALRREVSVTGKRANG